MKLYLALIPSLLILTFLSGYNANAQGKAARLKLVSCSLKSGGSLEFFTNAENTQFYTQYKKDSKAKPAEWAVSKSDQKAKDSGFITDFDQLEAALKTGTGVIKSGDSSLMLHYTESQHSIYDDRNSVSLGEISKCEDAEGSVFKFAKVKVNPNKDAITGAHGTDE